MKARSKVSTFRWVQAAAVLLAAMAGGERATAGPRPTTTIQLLDVSDWHAQLDPVSGVGGAAVLSSYFAAERAANPNTLTVTAGDAFGASPPLSGFFDDRPAILAQRLMGFDVDGFGNHNFDRGLAHLQALIDLAGAPAGVQPGRPFGYLAANLRERDDDRVDGDDDDQEGDHDDGEHDDGEHDDDEHAPSLTGVAPYRIFDVGGVKVGVVGITNPEAPTLVPPGSFGNLAVTEPVRAVNRARARARAHGAKVVVVICHLGVESIDPATGLASGPLIDFANQLTGFDVIFGDHTNVQYSGIHGGALVLENRSLGVTYARVTLTVDARSGRVAARSATFVTPLASAVVPDPAIVAMLAPFRAALSVQFDVPIGVATGVFARGGNVERRGEVAIGDLVTDALRLRYGVQLALTNGGGLRAPLPSAYAPTNHGLRRTSAGYAVGPPYDLVVGDVFTLLPFGNSVVTRTVTGAQLWAALENGVSRINAATCLGADGRFPQISGFRFSFRCSAPAGARVLSVALTDGTPLPPDATSYSFVTNDFINDGGDFYAVLNDGQGVTREVMADVVLDYIRALGTISPTVDGRITKVP